MTKTLRIPDETRFVRAFALAVDPGDTLGLLMEIGGLSSPDVGIVRRTREALIPAYDRASDRKDWEQAHTVGVLREALAQPDSVAYLAYRVRDNHRAAHSATDYAEALAIVGCAVDSLSSRRRPWEIEGNDLSLPEWRERVWKLLREAMPDNALPKPSDKPETEAKPCTCNETDSPKALTREHTGWCPAGDHSKERSHES
jgi:hypothetical protein